jgi:hypothetical protein
VVCAILDTFVYMNNVKKHRASKYEHKDQSVAPLSVFFLRLVRSSLFAIALIVFSTGIGTVGYHVLSNLGWVDSFYMACMILTGMGPTVNMDNDAAKIFSSFYALYSGVIFLGITAVFFAPVIHRVLHILHVEDGKDAD